MKRSEMPPEKLAVRRKYARDYAKTAKGKELRTAYHRKPHVRARRNAKLKEYNQKNRVKVSERRRINKLRNLGLTVERARVELAKTLCDCCFRPFGDQTPHIDHDHKTNTFRGMTHRECNVAIGMMADRVESLVLAARYVDPFYRSPLSVDSGNKYLDLLQTVADEDVAGLKKAQASYGNSWKQGGGANAFAMLKRKWDRMLNRVERPEINLDIFKGIALDRRGEGLIDDVRDLRRYLMLVEAELRARGFVAKHRDNSKEG
jgi:hypothetical protein